MENETKILEHTKAPWKVMESDEYDETRVIRDEGPGNHIGYVTVAEMGQDGDRALADAWLIAAAPDLLQSAKASEQCIADFLEIYKNGGSMVVMDEAVNSLKNDALKSVRAAIRKAEVATP